MNKLTITRSYILILIFILVGFVHNLIAQTPTWAIKPEYAHIDYYSDGLYKVKNGDFYGVVDSKGKVFVPVLADSITNMTAGYGLVLNVVKERNNTKGRYRLIGIIGEDKSYKEIYAEYYVDDYPFFSEGLLQVYNKKRLYGYINTKGELQINFKYESARPFSNGYAIVSKIEKVGEKIVSKLTRGKSSDQPPVSYIDYKDNYLQLNPSIGEIYRGYTFNDGEAVVISGDMKHVVINTSGEKLRELTETPFLFNRKGAVVFDQDIETDTEIYVPKYSGPSIYSSGNGYGYMDEGKVVVPSQFVSADRFVDDYAIVSPNGRLFGLLTLDSCNFSYKVVKTRLKSNGKSQIVMDYVFSIPSLWRDKSLTLEYNLDGKKMSYTHPAEDGETRTFSIAHDNPISGFRLLSDGLVLWEDIQKAETGKKTESLVEDEDLLENIYVRTSKKTTKAQYELFNRAPVSVILTNKHNKSITIDILIYAKVKGSSDYIMKPVSKKDVSIEPGGFYKISGEISAEKQIKPEKRNITIKLTTDSGLEKYIYREIIVEPIFIED